MANQAAVYRIVGNVHVSKWDDQLQEVVSGHQIKALWFATNHVLQMFVPDAVYSVENVDQLVREAGAKDSQVSALGG